MFTAPPPRTAADQSPVPRDWLAATLELQARFGKPCQFFIIRQGRDQRRAGFGLQRREAAGRQSHAASG